MQIEDPGHSYLLDAFDGGRPVRLAFIWKEQIDGQFVTVRDGTTNEEVLRALIDRTKFLDAKAPCEENAEAISAMIVALEAFEKRTAARKRRGVEGTPKA